MKRSVILFLFFQLLLPGIAQEVEIHVHEVQRGESLERIAKEYGVSVEDLHSHNQFLDKFFYVGQKLNVPIKVPPKVEYTFSEGSSSDYERTQKEVKKQRRKAGWNKFFRGVATAFSFGMASYPQTQMFSPSFSYNGGRTGNMDFLLDPNLAIIQTQQRIAQEQALNQQLMNLSIQQVQEQEQQEFQQARQFRPELTIEQFRQEKAQAYQMMKEAEREDHIETPHYSTVDAKCSNCGGEGWTHKKMYMGNGNIVDQKSRCALCHGNGTVKEKKEKWY